MTNMIEIIVKFDNGHKRTFNSDSEIDEHDVKHWINRFEVFLKEISE